MELIYYGADGGFYSSLAHGARELTVPDPEWQRPTVPEIDPGWNGEGDAPMIEVLDWSAVPPTITVPNPDCMLPPVEQLVEIPHALYQELQFAQSAGNSIQHGPDGYPVAVAPTVTAEDLVILAKVKRDRLLTAAALRIAPLQDAVDLDSATPAEVQQLRFWKAYRVELNRLEQQLGFPHEITWPDEQAVTTS
ncbi:tail fiber assembly protein [Pseudomonas sp. EZ-C24]|uniref:tail fiber assembly protein n=1 Tax=Pseudomonas sp. EZ-C24 TaxID=2753617 RepID=UPI0021D38879|nr:tail fiber assembly protein [Pseudomonas sp. EZ-C24]